MSNNPNAFKSIVINADRNHPRSVFVQDAFKLACAVRCARNCEELYAICRFERISTESTRDLSGYLSGKHFTAFQHPRTGDFNEETFEALQSEALNFEIEGI